MPPDKFAVPQASAREKARKSIFLSRSCMCSGFLATLVDGITCSIEKQPSLDIQVATALSLQPPPHTTLHGYHSSRLFDICYLGFL